MTKEEALEKPVMKMLIELDEENLKKDGISKREVFDFIDKEYAEWDIKPGIDGVYLGNGNDSDLALLGCGGAEVYDNIIASKYGKYLLHFYSFRPTGECGGDFVDDK